MRKLNNYGKITIGMLVFVTVFAVAGASYFFLRPAEAVGLSSRKVTLDSSAPATASKQVISYTSTTAVSAGQTIRIGYTDAWTIPTTFVVGDFSATGLTIVSACTAAASEATFTSSNTAASKNVTFTVCTGDTVAAGAITITIGTGATKITNPTKVAAAGTADILTITIAGTQTDSGNALVAIIEGVAVSVTIAESLTFTMAGQAVAACTGDSGTPTVIDTSGSATTIPFGTISTSNAFFAGCQLISVSTNAGNGFIVTTEENTNLRTSGGTNIADTVCDAACSESAGTAWATATNNGLGYSCENISGTACVVAGVTTYRQFACLGTDPQCDPGTGLETKQNVLSGAAPANNNQAKIHYKLSVSGTQAAGTYSNTVTYIATGTF